ILVFLLVKKNKIQAMPPDDIISFKQAVKEGWKSIFIFFGALIPILVTIGPLANYLQSNPNIGPEAIKIEPDAGGEAPSVEENARMAT
ncbi:hypothetical protein, partial [Klebsiella pneumoniae]|uniref:hypothetical protein n=1 Tax=Klebsiella pneumoniae TaxID=573 RepID=UPI00196835CA